MFGMSFLKKKAQPFSLDDQSLQSLSHTSPPESSAFDFPSEDDDSSLNYLHNETKAINHQDPVPYDPPRSEFSSSKPNYSSPMDLGFTTPQSKQSSPQNMNNFEQSNSSIHDEISRSKLDTMEAKMALMEARLSGIEHKLELVVTMLKHEISDETRKRMGLEEARASWKK